MATKRCWCWTAVVVVTFSFPVIVFSKPSEKRADPTGFYCHDNKQKDKNKNAEDIAPQDAEYQKGDASQYVGSETCRTCHEDLGESFDRGPHGKTTMVKHQGPQWQGCEACHGPGKEHAESGDPSKIIRFPSLSREEASKRCLGCHEFTEKHAKFQSSQHLKNNVGCLDCHAVHHPRVELKLLRVSQPSLCYGCHLNIKQDPGASHHPQIEGPTACTNCHDPHGNR